MSRPTRENEAPPTSGRVRGFTAEQLMLQAEIAREIQTATEFTGSFLRKVRESQCIELAEIAEPEVEPEIAADLIERGAGDGWANVVEDEAVDRAVGDLRQRVARLRCG